MEQVKNQEEHHKAKTFGEEFIELLNEHDIEFDEKFLIWIIFLRDFFKNHKVRENVCWTLFFLALLLYAAAMIIALMPPPKVLFKRRHGGVGILHIAASTL